MRALLGWLANRALVYLLLVAAIAAALALAPHWGRLAGYAEADKLGSAELAARTGALREEQQGVLAARVAEARALPLAALDGRARQRRAERRAAEARAAAARQGLLAPYRPSRILARSKAEIEIAVIDRELAVIAAARAPRAALAKAQDVLAAAPLVPTPAAIAEARARCAAARAALRQFESRWPIDRAVREALGDERSRLQAQAAAMCARSESLAQRRETGLAAARTRAEAEAALARLAAPPLSREIAAGTTPATLADIAWQALIALIALTLLPLCVRLVCWHVLAPLAERWPPLRFAQTSSGPAPGIIPPHHRSAISLSLTLAPGETLMVRQDYLQSAPSGGTKRTRWLLDLARPLTSLASGMRFLIAITGAGERVTLSAVRDPFAELALLALPEGAAAVIRPSALAAIVQREGAPTRIISHWRLFSLPAWLTGQLRFLAFQGPVQVVVKGGRGVRVEAAERGRILGPDQVIGFTTDTVYSAVRTVTFWPYFLGREPLLADRVEGTSGVVLIEEAPLAGKSGIRRGLEGAVDAALKLVGV